MRRIVQISPAFCSSPITYIFFRPTRCSTTRLRVQHAICSRAACDVHAYNQPRAACSMPFGELAPRTVQSTQTAQSAACSMHRPACLSASCSFSSSVALALVQPMSRFAYSATFTSVSAFALYALSFAAFSSACCNVSCDVATLQTVALRCSGPDWHLRSLHLVLDSLHFQRVLLGRGGLVREDLCDDLLEMRVDGFDVVLPDRVSTLMNCAVPVHGLLRAPGTCPSRLQPAAASLAFPVRWTFHGEGGMASHSIRPVSGLQQRRSGDAYVTGVGVGSPPANLASNYRPGLAIFLSTP